MARLRYQMQERQASGAWVRVRGFHRPGDAITAAERATSRRQQEEAHKTWKLYRAVDMQTGSELSWANTSSEWDW